LTVQDHITLQQALIATLNGRISTARSLGDAPRLADLETELAAAEETLARLQAA
jgi:uncharacterized coiled-coil protein SlyX